VNGVGDMISAFMPTAMGVAIGAAIWTPTVPVLVAPSKGWSS
jgi:hypothetical protein